MRILAQGVRPDSLAGRFQRGVRVSRLQRLMAVADHGVEGQVFQLLPFQVAPIRPGIFGDVQVGQQRVLVEIDGCGDRTGAPLTDERLEAGHVAIERAGRQLHVMVVTEDGVDTENAA